MAYRPPYHPRMSSTPLPPRQFPPNQPIPGRPPFLPPPPHQFGYGPPPPGPGGYGAPAPPLMAYPPPFPPMACPPHPRFHPRHSRPWNKRPRNWIDRGGRGQGRYFRAKRPHTDGAREFGNFGYNDSYYDLSMFEDPWRELLEARGIVNDGGVKHSGMKGTGEEEEGEEGRGAEDSSGIDAQKKANGSASPEESQTVGLGDANHTSPITGSSHESSTISGEASTVHVCSSDSSTVKCSS